MPLTVNLAIALGKIGDSRVLEPINELLEDEREYVLEDAKSALEKIKAKKM